MTADLTEGKYAVHNLVQKTAVETRFKAMKETSIHFMEPFSSLFFLHTSESESFGSTMFIIVRIFYISYWGSIGQAEPKQKDFVLVLWVSNTLIPKL